MKTIEQLKDWAIEDGDVPSPQTITIVPTVRTGSSYPLPPWSGQATSGQSDRASKD